MAYENDKELATYRNLVEQPTVFEDGFSWGTVVAALLLGLLVTPGAMYITLVAGEGVGPAARWMTVFLFSELAKRSLKEMRQQEVFVLFYMTGHVMASCTATFFLIYAVDSDAFIASGITKALPNWVAPVEFIQSGKRTLFDVVWLPALGLFVMNTIIARIDQFGLGYFLYRITSDGERLPFPMAPVGASGIMAMAETREKSLQWRPACFSIGGMLGLFFGVVYIAVPAVTGIIFAKPVTIIPIPWIEMTPAFKDILPATAMNLVPNLGAFVIGMVLPFWAVVGGFIGLIFTIILNPILHAHGVLHSWEPGMDTVETLFNNQLDFYLSFGMGINLFIAVLGLWQAFLPLLKARKASNDVAQTIHGQVHDPRSFWQRVCEGNPLRGDISPYLSLGIYLCSTALYLTISSYLVPGFPVMFFLLYAFMYTPLISYATAKVEGLVGQNLTIPYVREAAFILSGCKGVEIWYAPIPIYNYGTTVKDFRIIELTGTRLGSIIKTDLVTTPIMIMALILFTSFIWSQEPLNSDSYPFVKRVWDLSAKNTALMYSSTLVGKRSSFFEALDGDFVGIGLLAATGMYTVLSSFGLPVMLVFGLVRGLNQTNPGSLLCEFIAALIGRYYFAKKYGDMWLKFTPAIFAGFTCGVGLVGMISVALRLIAGSVTPLPY